MKFLVILSVLISLKTCHSNTKVVATEYIDSNISGTYYVETLNNTPVSEHKLYLNFNQTNHQLSGFSGCNRFSGRYSLQTDSIKVGPLASTKMFCEETANKIESEFHQALSTIDNIVLKDGILQFISKEKIVLTAIKEHITFNYSAISRGRLLDININDSIVSMSKNRDTKPVSKAISRDTWNQLHALLGAINLDSISTLKSPTEARFYDGASIGTLKISKNGTVYESATFDHGTPPREIEALVKEILSLAENVE
jgi:heat shock protein HslJ